MRGFHSLYCLILFITHYLPLVSYWFVIQVCGCHSTIDWQGWRFCQWWHMVPCCAVCYEQWRSAGNLICFIPFYTSLRLYSDWILCYWWWFYAFNQSYAAIKAREYLDKPAIHETMVKVSSSFFSFLISNDYFGSQS